LIFALGFLVAQSVIVFAEFNHPLHQANNACSICLAANHLSGGPVTTTQIIHPFFQHTFVDYFPVQLITTTVFTAYSVRAPPLFQNRSQ
jgi:hypothetical protein